MSTLYSDNDKYAWQSTFAIVEAYNAAVKDLVRQRFAEFAGEWNDFVAGPAYDVITKADIAAIEAKLLANGYRFEPSAMSSAAERPHAYRDSGVNLADFSFEHPAAPTAEPDGEGRELRGVGDNVVSRKTDLIGIARYVRTSDKVLEYLTQGVPPNTIAVVEDSGGTLTAPVLEKFTGVLCAGVTTRSHLAILTREYGIPCLMNARLSGIRDGDRLMLEVTARAKTADDYQTGADVSARVFRLPPA